MAGSTTSSEYLESSKMARNMGIETLRLTFFLAGGSSVALLAFMGNKASSGATMIDLGNALVLDVVAAFLAVIALGWGCLEQIAFTNATLFDDRGAAASEAGRHDEVEASRREFNHWMKHGKTAWYATVLLTVFSWVALAGGTYSAYSTFKHASQKSAQSVVQPELPINRSR